MPRTFFYCEVDGQPVSDSDCLDCARNLTPRTDPATGKARHCQYSYPFIYAQCRPDADRVRAGISATNLTGPCVRQAMWEKVRPYGRRPSQGHAALDGTAWHALMQECNEDDVFGEQRLRKVMPSGRVLTGVPDRYSPRLGVLEDYKHKKCGHLFGPRDIPEGYEEQMNILRYMIETGCVVIDTGEILKGPVTAIYLLPSDHSTQERVSVPLWDLADAERYIEQWLEEYERFADDPSYVPPRSLDPSSLRSRRFCEPWCPFYQACLAEGGTPWHPRMDFDHTRSRVRYKPLMDA